MSVISRLLSMASAFVMGFTVIDALCFAVTNDTLAQHFLDGGSPLSRALFEMIPGMTAWEFFAANAIVLGCICVLLFISVYGTMSDNDFRDKVSTKKLIGRRGKI